MHVLLLEPNTLLATTYTQALQQDGCSVAHAASAQMAVFAADKQQPDVVVLELQLPSHSGLEFLHEFRSYTEWKDVPVIVHSMLPPTQTLLVEESLRRDLGVRTMLYKPRTTLAQLLRAVRELAPAPTGAK
ncbi:MAG TPA: response regulator [Candidatus Saccharimonadales bacterium]|nr:response regulator [Candidatus Saccharimonadales bacterium]